MNDASKDAGASPDQEKKPAGQSGPKGQETAKPANPQGGGKPANQQGGTKPANPQGAAKPGAGQKGGPAPKPGGGQHQKPQANQDNAGAKGPGKPAPAAPSQPDVKPIAQPARLKRRHWGLLLSFSVIVLLPLIATIVYLWLVAEDQYSSVTGFTVRQEETAGAQELLGGLAQLTGTNPSVDGDILYEYILSQGMLRAVEERVGLRAHYSAYWDKDPVFALWPDSSIEDLEWYWRRVVRISYNGASGLMELRVLAFSPEIAQAIASEIVALSQEMINALNNRAREDAMRYARDDLIESVERLKTAREALTAFRTRTRIVDPEADIQGRLGVMSNLQQQLAESLIEFDLLRGSVSDTDPRLQQELRRITAIQDRISQERQSFASASLETGAGAEDYPDLIAEYEGLVVDREFAEQTYRAALAALDVALAKAERQSRYLATYVPPTLAETSEYPRRFIITGLVALFLLLSWSIMALIYYSIRDRG